MIGWKNALTCWIPTGATKQLQNTQICQHVLQNCNKSWLDCSTCGKLQQHVRKTHKSGNTCAKNKKSSPCLGEFFCWRKRQLQLHWAKAWTLTPTLRMGNFAVLSNNKQCLAMAPKGQNYKMFANNLQFLLKNCQMYATMLATTLCNLQKGTKT